MKPLLATPPSELEAFVREHGGQPFHARGILTWVLARGATTFDEMTDLSVDLRKQLTTNFLPLGSRVKKKSPSPDGTTKLLIELQDDEVIETVHMPGTKGPTICVSTQVGCPVACRFCASGLDGLVRNLTAAEIAEQFLHARRIGPVSRAVIMGIGEPTLNLDALLEALGWITDPDLFGLGARRVTISTVGYPDRVRKMARAGKPYNLAVSLHAPNDALRSTLIPTMQKVAIQDIIEAASEYFDRTGREVTFEYVLLAGVNDSLQQAKDLAIRLRGRRALVNLIPYNPIPGSPYQRPVKQAVTKFAQILEERKIPTTVRWSKGLEAEAACGQLRIQQQET